MLEFLKIPKVMHPQSSISFTDFNDTKNEANLARIKLINYILLFVSLILIYVDINKFMAIWTLIPNYRFLFYSHIFTLFFSITYLYILYKSSKIKTKYTNFPIDTLIVLLFIFVLLLLCIFMAVNAQGTHKQISAYIIGIFCLASGIILNPYESSLLFIITYLIFVLSMVNFPMDATEISGHIINAFFLTALAYGLSIINYKFYLNNYINKGIIFRQNNELKNSKKVLEDSIRIRTEELIDANQKLLNEVNLRHEAEIAAIKGKLLYEEKSKLLEEANEYEKLRSNFLANISHELRTPLNVIMSAQQIMGYILKEDSIENKSGKLNHYNKIVKQNCFRLIRLLSNLIDITKIDVGSFNIKLINEDIVKIVEDITLSVVSYVEDKNINIIFDTEIEEKIIACDPDKIERIILNLISNAIKFTPKDGHIYVSIKEDTDKIIISVKDSGIGIPPEMKDKIFQRFIQVDNSIRRQYEGSGIGLSLVKLLVELHKGVIYLESTLGVGSEFFVELPINAVENYERRETINDAIAAIDNKIDKINIEFSDIYF